MELGLSNSLLAGDPRLIDHIVGEVKSQGIFDKFRKECIADVDTKPAYQNLRTRVESSVNSFLNKQTWRTDLNKNQLRETLRKHIHDAPYLEVGVERIVDQVVNPKIYSVFMPQIEDVVYKFLGIERPKPQRNGACDLKDLLPKDLDPVSPESDRNSLKDISLESVDENINEVFNGNDQKSNTSKFDEKIPDIKCNSVKKEVINMENGENSQPAVNIPAVKPTLNASFKSDETNKTEEEEEDSPVFEPIDIMNLNESNMSNDSHLSGISELTSHRSQSPDFLTEFSRDNFDCSNQDSQLSKVSSNSRLSIVTDFGSSNHASTPLPESKDDSKYVKDNFKVVREFDTNKDNKFNFEVIKNKENSRNSNSSKENSRDAHEFKDGKIKDESKAKYSRDKYDSKSSRDKDHDSRRRHSKSDKYSRSKSKDKNETESQDSKDSSSKYNKMKDGEKKDEIKDLKDLYKEKIRELREKKELTEKEKLGKDNKESTKINKDSKDKKENSSREKDDYKKNYKSSSSSSRSSSYHNSSKISRSADSKDSRDKSNNKRDDRRHSNGKNESKSSNRSKRDSKMETKSESKTTLRPLKDKKRRDEKKSKSTDDHSSLRKNSNDRRSTDRDGSNGSSSKYSHKSSYSTSNSSSKFGPSTSLTKDTNKDHHASSEPSDSVHDNLRIIFGGCQNVKDLNYKSVDNPPKRLDPGSMEICLPLKKRPLHNDGSLSESQLKKPKLENKKPKKKIEKDIFRIDTDVTSVPDEERVQIIEIPDEEYEQPYPDKEPILSLEETKKIILDTEMHPVQSKLSEMEQSIRQSLSEMMSDHKLSEAEDALTSPKLGPVMDSNTLLETLTDDSNNDSESFMLSVSNIAVSSNIDFNLEKIKETIGADIKENVTKLEISDVKIKEENVEQDEKIEAKIEEFIKKNEQKTNKNIGINIKRQETSFEEDEKTSKIGMNKIDTIKGKYNTEIDMHVEKVEMENFEMINKNVIINIENMEFSDTEASSEISIGKSLQKTEQDMQKFKIDSKEFSEKIQGVVNATERTESYGTITKENVNVHQNEKRVDDNVDDLDEDNKLIIDEEFIEKQNDQDNTMQYEVKVKDSEKLDEYTEKEKNKAAAKYNEHKINEKQKLIEIDKNRKKHIGFKSNIREEKIHDEVLIDNNSDKKLNKNNDNIEKPVKFVQGRIQKQIKSQLINELSKVREEKRTIEKQNEEVKISEKSIKTVAVIETSIKGKIIKTPSEKSKISISSFEKENVENPIEQVEDDAEDDSAKEAKIDVKVSKLKEINDENFENNDVDKAKKLYIICQGEEEKIEQKLSAVFNKNSRNISEVNALLKSEESKFDINISSIQEEEEEGEVEEDDDDDLDDDDDGENSDTIQDELFERPTTSKGTAMDVLRSSRINELTSPFEEECHYLESDNQRYLIFKKYLEKLEADPSRSLEDMIESFGGVVVSAIPTPALPVLPTKRQHLASPLTDMLITTSNNNNDQLEMETPSEETSENFSNPIKKRKLGRVRKPSGPSTIAVNLQQEQQLPPQQLQHPQHAQLQPQQVAIINGENFVMPLSPESDVSATSEKNPGNALKDDRSRHRSNQRYSSDDLYKPRPLFSSSSRRNRRFHQT